MQIILSNSDGHKFTTARSWDEANQAARAIFKRNFWSDLYYQIIFDDGKETAGSIDLEPASYHTRHQREIVTNHMRTFWGNVAKLAPNKAPYFYSEEDINFTKGLLNYL